MKNILNVLLILTSMMSYAQRINYSVEIVDHKGYWDSETAQFKVKQIELPATNLSLVQQSPDAKSKAAIAREVNRQLDSLRTWYPEFPAQPQLLENQQIYMTSDGSMIALTLYSINFESAQIAVISVQSKKHRYTYSDANSLGMDITLYHGKKHIDGYIIYGHLQGNPETTYAGDFKLTFSRGKRMLEYSYFEGQN